ncbi:hypothetical protein [Solidesulfovibrio sp.]|uniref:hypothetical protein n=1 Tax=Solidesulfovibrio sp. TaxID=2910990 RepID=UPI002B20FAC9|nr:hypothetical protein [Solidesulfovibrio sp.]MEA5090540.1 hypothetical protein [Solidesulfovibrio sp.]
MLHIAMRSDILLQIRCHYCGIVACGDGKLGKIFRIVEAFVDPCAHDIAFLPEDICEGCDLPVYDVVSLKQGKAECCQQYRQNDKQQGVEPQLPAKAFQAEKSPQPQEKSFFQIATIRDSQAVTWT